MTGAAQIMRKTKLLWVNAWNLSKYLIGWR